MNKIITKKKALTQKEVFTKLERALKIVGSDVLIPSNSLSEIFGGSHDNMLKKIDKEYKNIENLVRINERAKIVDFFD